MEKKKKIVKILKKEIFILYLLKLKLKFIIYVKYNIIRNLKIRMRINQFLLKFRLIFQKIKKY
jgi:hypothetical protein